MTVDADRLFAGPAGDPTRYWVAAADVDGAIAGGEGLVYRAHRSADGETVALKVLTNTVTAEFPRLAERAALLESVRHPHLMAQIELFLGCPFGDGSAADPDEFDVAYSVATWIEGRPLTEVADDADVEQKLRWIAELATGLDHLHTQRSDVSPDGIVHRDVKPSNVRVTDDGTAVLLDFGVARPVVEDDMTKGVGTYLWRAPEVLSGDNVAIGTAADVWGLGAVAHWLLTGAPPQLDGAAASRERLSTALESAGHPQARPLARHLADLLQSSPGDRPSDLASWTQEMAAPGRRRRRRVALAAVAAVVAVIAVIVAATRPSTAPETPALAAFVSPNAIACSGTGRAALLGNPPLVREPHDVTFTLAAPSTYITCSTAQSEIGRVRLEELEFTINGYGCNSLLPPADDPMGTPAADPLAARGTATATWADGATSDLKVTITLENLYEGTMAIKVVGGRFDHYNGSGKFTVPLGSWEGDCDNGITRNNEVTLDAVQLTAG